jgi:hypothetical protein
MSTTHIVFDSGTAHLAPGPAHQIGPNLDVRKYSQIRFMAHDFLSGFEETKFDLLVKESAVELPLRKGLNGLGRALSTWFWTFRGESFRFGFTSSPALQEGCTFFYSGLNCNA